MRYLRTLSNSLAAAALGTCYLLVLFLQLNPRMSIDPFRLAPLVTGVGLFYLVHLTAIVYVALVVGQLLASAEFSPAWISVGLLAWLGAVGAAAAAILMWVNQQTFGIALAPETTRAMMTGAGAMGVSALLFAAVGVTRRISHGSLRRTWAASFVVAALFSVAVPLLLRGPGRTPPLETRPLDTIADSATGDRESKVTIIAIDAASIDLITKATAEGRLPNFGRLLDAGAVLHLATLHPTTVEAVWSAVATGKLPQKNGVRSAGVYQLPGEAERVRLLPDFCFANRLVHFGFLIEEPHTATAIRTRPFWSVLSMHGVTVGVTNWPLTYPAPPVRGYVVSDAYARLALTASGLDDRALVYPAELRREVVPLTRALAADPTAVFAVSAESALDARYRDAGRTDLMYGRIAQALAASRPTQVNVVRFQSLDPIGHYFLRYATPSAFGDVSEAERVRLGSVLEDHYAAVDEAIGRAIDGLGPADLLLVVSGYGMEPLGLSKRLLERMIGDPDISGTHESAPDGFLMAYGAPVAKGHLRRASVVDVLPTLLYFLGLPIGRDMDGYARTDLFEPRFTEERPIAFIPTYDR